MLLCKRNRREHVQQSAALLIGNFIVVFLLMSSAGERRLSPGKDIKITSAHRHRADVLHWAASVCLSGKRRGAERRQIAYLSPFEPRIRPILGPIRKSNILSVFAVHVTHKFNTYFGIFVRKRVIKKLNSPRYC